MTETASNRINDAEYEIRKHLPPSFPRNKNDIYITRKTDLSAQKARITRLLDNEVDEVVLHGLGSAVSRTINVALQVQRRLADSVRLCVKTGTVQVTDDLFPLYDEFDFRTRNRNVSAIDIKISRISICEMI